LVPGKVDYKYILFELIKIIVKEVTNLVIWTSKINKYIIL